MDDLVHHCLQELSFDGNLGSNVSRLRDFVCGFYTKFSSQYTQHLDNAFYDFVWNLIVQQPTVRVGKKPPGLTSEVYIAPQISQVRKAKAKGEVVVKEEPPELDVINDSRNKSLEELKQEHGDDLRIAVDPKTVCAAITGSHTMPSRMTPMVYSALQIITRGREDGVTVLELGQRSGYDQKTCHYLVKQLLELGLVVKLRRKGVSTHSVMHKYFHENSAAWKEIREEELQATDALKEPNLADEDLCEDDADPQSTPAPEFTAIDDKHLSSLPLVRARVIKLLKMSKNNIHPTSEVLTRIGFTKPTKTDRRFFRTRIAELVEEGIVENVMVPSNKAKTNGKQMVKCLQLASTKGEQQPEDQEATDSHVDSTIERAQDPNKHSGVKMNLTLHKQILDLLEESGVQGMTLNDLVVKLGQFDKRTIELILTRSTNNRHSHLNDLRVVQWMESFGREQRKRYYTSAAFQQLAKKEQFSKEALEKNGYIEADLSDAGNFASFDPSLFYTDEVTLFKYVDEFNDGKTPNTKMRSTSEGPAKKGRPRKMKELGEVIIKSKKRKRLDEEGQDAEKSTSQKRSRVAGKEGTPQAKEILVATEEPIAPKKRGRPPKQKIDDDAPQPKRKRGRPPKNTSEVVTVQQDVLEEPSPTLDDSTSTVPQKKRGRPRKASIMIADKEVDTSKRRGRPKKVQTVVRDDTRSTETSQVAAGAELMDVDPGKTNTQSHLVLGQFPMHIQLNNAEPSKEARAQLTGKDVQLPAPFPDAGSLPAANELPVTPTESASLPRVDHTIATQNPVDIPIDPVLLEECIPFSPTDRSSVQPPSVPQIPPPVTDALGKSTGQSRAKANVSQLRRENEIYRVLTETFGGIANTSTKDFADAHLTLLETLAKAGELASAPPRTQMDKRTLKTVLDRLEDRGQIKILKTSVTTHTGLSRPVTVVYLPTIEQDRINAFLLHLSQSTTVPHAPPIKKITEPIEYGAAPAAVKPSLPLQLLQTDNTEQSKRDRDSTDEARAKELWSYDDATIKAVLLTEKTTLGQFYGFIVGRVLRARELHLTILRAFESDSASSNLVSRDKRIIHSSYFFCDLPLGVYLAILPSLTYQEELTTLLASEEGRQLRVQDLPPRLHSALQIGRSRHRERILQILDLLRMLGLVLPLQPCNTDNPWITCDGSDKHPTMFVESSLDGATSLNSPAYWHITTSAPIHHWAASETRPPFLGITSTASFVDAVAYWQQLQNACTKNSLIEAITAKQDASSTPNMELGNIGRKIRSPSGWNNKYMFTWHQRQYLKRFVDVASASTPADRQDEDQMKTIAWVVNAPHDAVQDFYSTLQSRLTKDLENARARKQKQQVEDKKAAEAKIALANKAAETRQQREKDWDDMVARVHPEPLKGTIESRVRQVRSRFLHSTSTKDLQKWENAIRETIQEAQMAAARVLNKKGNRKVRPAPPLPAPPAPATPTAPPPPIAVNPPERSVAELITQQGPPLPPPTPKQRKKGDAGETDKKKVKRRRFRFRWSHEYEELAIDAHVVIKARCRGLSRVELGALDQVFTAIPRNTVRQRLAHIRESPSMSAYLNRLEDRFYELWVQHRGTSLLPDDDPKSVSNFDLPKHIEFLRKHIDKNALRIGFSAQQETSKVGLPATLEQMLEQYEVVEQPSTTPIWDIMWNVNAEEGREKRLSQVAFTQANDPLLFSECSVDINYLAEAALKMVLGTPNDRYDPEAASRFLKHIGDVPVLNATRNLLNRGVVSKHQRDPTQEKPGRRLRISEINQNALGGSIPFDTFQDAAALEEGISTSSEIWREWPLVVADGDLAALTQHVSEYKVDFKVDTSQAQAARPEIDWNSKKADDDHIETTIYVRFSEFSIPTTQSRDSSLAAIAVEINEYDPSGHGLTIDGKPASCRKTCEGLVDCRICLEDAKSMIESSLNAAERELVAMILDATHQAGKSGVAKANLLMKLGASRIEQARDVLYRLTEGSTPLVFWAGYSKLLVVSANYLESWSVLVSEEPRRRVLPRRWIDITGCKMLDVWEAAVRAVIGVIVFHPGISQAELRWRLRPVYDRHEVNDILRYLQQERFVGIEFVHHNLGPRHDGATVTALDEDEERSAFCFLRESSRWYMV